LLDECILNIDPHHLPVFRMDQVAERSNVVHDQIIRLVSGESVTTFTGEYEGMIPIIPALVNHARDVVK